MKKHAENLKKETAATGSRELWLLALRRFLHHRLSALSLLIICVYLFFACFSSLLPFYSYKRSVPIHQNLPPSLTKNAGTLLYAKQKNALLALAKKEGRTELNGEEEERLEKLKLQILTETYEDEKGRTRKTHERRYLWGTDYLGRDLLARVVLGSRISIFVGILGALCAVFIGTAIGAFAGYKGGIIDYLITRFIDIMYGLPYVLLVIIFMAFLGNNIINLFLALALISWLTVARVVRGQIISLKNSEFVKAAQVVGAPTWWIITRHLIPNTLNIIIVFATLRIPVFIILESFLSFLGLGISAPLASWGTLINDSIDSISSAPWQLFFPSIVMCVFLLSMNFLGDGLRDVFDPRHAIK